MALRVCMITEDFWPNIGGVASHVLGLSKALAGNGCRLSIIAPKGYLNQSPLIIHPNCDIVGIPRVLRSGKIRLAEFALRASWFALRKKTFFDVVHWHGLWAEPLVAQFIKARVRIFTNHTSMFVRRADNQFWRCIIKGWQRNLAAVIAPSIELTKLSRSVFNGIPCYYVPNGVDPEFFRPLEKDKTLMAKLGITSQDFVILVPRRLVWKNGVQFLIKAMPQVKKHIHNVKVIIVGTGPIESTLKEVCKKLKVEKEVMFVGAVPNSEMVYYYSIADVVVIPSLIEATSISILEAMACGKVVIATNVGGIPELVQNGANGVIVPPGDSKALAERIVEIYHTGKFINLSARKWIISNFSWQVIAKKTLEIYRTFLG